MNNYIVSHKTVQQKGFTLIELMISLVLGLLVIAAAVAIFLSAQRSMNMQTGMSELQQNSIFGLSQITHDLRHLNLNTTQDQVISKKSTGAGIVFSTLNNPDVPAKRLTGQGVIPTNMSVASDRLTIQFQPSLNGLSNCEGRPLNNPAIVNVQSYYLEENSKQPGRYNLMCDAGYPANANSMNGSGAVVILQDVEAFRVRFAVRDGVTKLLSYKKPNEVLDTDRIVAIEIAVAARSSSSVGFGNKIKVPTSSNPFTLAGQPVFLTNPDKQDRFLREVFSQVVAIRNAQGGN